ncbi:hypothetical protein AMATHDRAFT_50847 [Amanita thiersii Skay4041]|uniref:DUF6534 domain-containing protein n=1 Tax=Amanita thiersii Skay4041 TaxID=703135 RepID=A0A2A9NBL0_9AGAR|nr:hypothetical protein AMATHDRAFT_50847 [Amanita thiersii Skay4041]
MWTKAAVYTLYGLETVHTIAITWGFRSYLVVFFSNDRLDGLNLVVQNVMSHVIPVAGGLAALIANFTYTHRIYVITSSKILTYSLYLLTVLQLIVTVIFTIIPGIRSASGSTTDTGNGIFGHRIIPSQGFIWLGLSTICDMVIATAMVYSLSREKILSSATRWKVSRLVRLIIETGTATVNIISLILLATAKQTGTSYLAPMIVLSKIYGNAMMVLLNNRLTIVGSRTSKRPPSLSSAAGVQVMTMTTATAQFSTLMFQTLPDEQRESRNNSITMQVEDSPEQKPPEELSVEERVVVTT